jgi:hypothetical protein
MSLWILTCEFLTTQSLLLLRGGLKGFGAGSRRTLGFCEFTMSRLPPQQNLLSAHTSKASTQTYTSTFTAHKITASKSAERGGRVRSARVFAALEDVGIEVASTWLP